MGHRLGVVQPRYGPPLASANQTAPQAPTASALRARGEDSPPIWASRAFLTVRAAGDFGSSTETVEVLINDQDLPTLLSGEEDGDTVLPTNYTNVLLDPDLWSAEAPLQVRLTASSAVNFGGINGAWGFFYRYEVTLRFEP